MGVTVVFYVDYGIRRNKEKDMVCVVPPYAFLRSQGRRWEQEIQQFSCSNIAPKRCYFWWAPTSDLYRVLLSTISLPVSSFRRPLLSFLAPPFPRFRVSLSSQSVLCFSPLRVPAVICRRDANETTKLKNSEYSTSVIAFYLCSNRRWPQLSHHTVFLSTDWKESWDSAFGKLPGGELGERLGPRPMVVRYCAGRCQYTLQTVARQRSTHISGDGKLRRGCCVLPSVSSTIRFLTSLGQPLHFDRDVSVAVPCHPFRGAVRPLSFHVPIALQPYGIAANIMCSQSGRQHSTMSTDKSARRSPPPQDTTPPRLLGSPTPSLPTFERDRTDERRNYLTHIQNVGVLC